MPPPPPPERVLPAHGPERAGARPGPQADPPWHAQSTSDVLARLVTGERGLTEDEAARRLAEGGPNALFVAPPVSVLAILRDQVRSVIVALLVGAAVISLAFGDLLEAASIAIVLLLNVGIGFWTEWRSRRSMESLRRMEVQGATVVREGLERHIDARDLVPGDVVVLDAGVAIPADLRLLSVAELSTNEAPLSGESLPVAKAPEAVPADALLPDRASMVFKGTLTVSGRGRGVVVATGQATEIGRISELVQGIEEEQTPLERRLAQLGRKLVLISLGVGVVVIGLGLLRGDDVWLVIETGIALAIAAVPEGLPVVAVITLSVGMRRMARRNALVRRMVAVEALGSTTVICTDKTGTLTAGEMTAETLVIAGRELRVTGRGYAPEGDVLEHGRPVQPTEVPGLELALRVCALANRSEVHLADDGWTVSGDPTEGALLVLARKLGFERSDLAADWPELGEVPFASERMFMATFHRAEGGRVLALVKGAATRLIDRSSRYLDDAGEALLDDAAAARLRAENDALAERGYRVLALAYRELEPGAALDETAVRELVFLGHVGLIDPAAEGVKETIARLRGAGIRTVMITGDQSLTALAVARDLGVLTGAEGVLDGSELAGLDEEGLAARLEGVGAFSRMSPEDKVRIVRAFQARGECVGMLGDGVNDAAALKAAEIGVAMGRRGTDVAKETADVVLADDRFETIAAAVEGGRVIYDNIRKFVFYLFSCNLAEVLVLLIAGVLGLPLPLLPLQILWLNLITDVFPALALAMEPAESDVMRRPPIDPAHAILSRRFFFAVVWHASVMTGCVLAVFAWAHSADGAGLARTRTLTFLALASAQLFHVFNARSERAVLGPARLFQNGWIWLAVLLSAGLMALVVLAPPLADALHLVRPSAGELGFVLALSSLPLWIGQAGKAWSRAREEGARGAARPARTPVERGGGPNPGTD